MSKHKGSKKTLALFTLILLPIVASWTYFYIHKVEHSRLHKQEEKYNLLSKRLFVENQNDIIVNLAPLRSQINDYLSKQGYKYSFYLEYLPSGTSIRAGDSTELVGASLMKLPVIMDIYKAADENKINLDDKIRLNDQTLSSGFGTLYQEGVGREITYREAVKLALTESDNTAARALLLETEKYNSPKDRALNFLDVDFNETEMSEQPTILISARSYSSFLQCLYLSCFNSYESSQEILQYMTESDFHTRIEAGVEDKSIKIAHKIGTFSEQSSSDCGIVYVPRRPYSFCLMINSTDMKIDDVIAEVSKMTYEYIKNTNVIQADGE
jgi:beta-lactamase class A